MPIKLKSIPEDFIVEEKAALPLKKKGAHAVYRLEKKSLNTIDALMEIAGKFKVPFADFAYGGRKDRHAATSQYVTIKGKKRKDLTAENYKFTFAGFMDRPMGPDLIEGNRFAITVRNATTEEAQKIRAEAESVKVYGFPNYFDDQRFGSVDKDQGFLVDKLLKSHLNGALKVYLTGIYPFDSKSEKERKTFFIDNWKKWTACLTKAESVFEKKAFETLKSSANQTMAFEKLLNLIPRWEMSMYFSAYESFLWNQMLGRLFMERRIQGLKKHPGAVGDYIFYTQLPKPDLEYLQAMSIPTIAANAKPTDHLSDRIYHQTLKDNGIEFAMFRKIKVRQYHYKSILRPALAFPREWDLQSAVDETKPDRTKVVLKFFLPRGSFGTMLVKRLVA